MKDIGLIMNLKWKTFSYVVPLKHIKYTVVKLNDLQSFVDSYTEVHELNELIYNYDTILRIILNKHAAGHGQVKVSN